MMPSLISASSLASYTDTLWDLILIGGPYIAAIAGFNLAFFVAGIVQENMRQNRSSHTQ